MQYLSGIAQRKTLLLAFAIMLAGCAILVWTVIGGAHSTVAASPALDAEPALFDDSAAAEQETLPTETPVATPEPMIVVYVSGAVRAPDVYRLPPGARVKDVVAAAGGFVVDAQSDAINLAARLSDEQHVHVPWQGAAGETSQLAVEATRADAVQETAPRLLDLNRADAVDLETLPGIGPTTAERIVAYREEHGPFTSVDDLQQVKGIGPALFAKIAPLVRVGS